MITIKRSGGLLEVNTKDSLLYCSVIKIIQGEKLRLLLTHFEDGIEFYVGTVTADCDASHIADGITIKPRGINMRYDSASKGWIMEVDYDE